VNPIHGFSNVESNKSENESEYKEKIRVQNTALALFLTLQWLGPHKLYVPLQLCRYKYLSINKSCLEMDGNSERETETERKRVYTIKKENENSEFLLFLFFILFLICKPDTRILQR